MIVTIGDVDQLAELARQAALSHPVRSPERRAAAHLWVSAITSTSADGMRRAIGSFGAPDVQADALDLLGRLCVTAVAP